MLCPRGSATNKTDTALALRELKRQQGCQTMKPRNKALKDRARGWGALTAPRNWRETGVRPKAFPAHLRMRPVSRGNSRRTTWVGPQAERPRFPGPLLRRLEGLMLKLQYFGHLRRKWQPTPVFLPGDSQGQRSLVGFRLWGRTESDTTDAGVRHVAPPTWFVSNFLVRPASS